MKKELENLSRLQRLAKLKSDLEMRRFSAYRASVVSTKGRIATLKQDLHELYRGDGDHSIAGARLMNALAGEKMRALQREDAQLRKMLPGFEAARQLALREFGRAEVLHQLGENLKEEGRLNEQRKSD